MAKKNDMTTGTGWKKVIIFAVPLMFGNILQQLYNTVDGIVVGRYVSEMALAAVGNCGTLTVLYVGVANGLANGCGVVISQFFGAGRKDYVRKAASTAYAISISCSIVLFLIGYFGARFLLGTIMNIQEPEILEGAVEYFKIYACGVVFQCIYNTTAAMMRSMGDSRASLYFLMVSTVTNLVLDLLFVIKFNLGIKGVALATIIAQMCSMVFSLLYMNSKYEVFRTKIREIRYDKELGGMCFKLGIPSTLQLSVVGIGGVLMQRTVNHFGKTLMSAFVVGNKMENYIFIPIQALGVGMNVFTGQNMGAGMPQRVKDTWKRIVFVSFLLSGMIAITVYICANPIANLFKLGSESHEIAVTMIRFLCTFSSLFAVYIPTTNLFTGAGDAYHAMLCSFSTLFVKITSALIMVYIMDVGQQAVWIATPLGWLTGATIAWTRYFGGKWQEKALVKKNPAEKAQAE